MDTPAGWYPTSDGPLRSWDGSGVARWDGSGVARWVGWGAALVLFTAGCATAGPADPTSAEDSRAAGSRTPSAAATSASPAVPETAAEGTALAAVALLAVKGRSPRTGYDRGRFGQAWADVDRNGCDTRNDILRRDLKDFTLRAASNGCLVLSGTLVGPYTGDTIEFVRGADTSSAVQIDHVVALSDAWQKGAQRLDDPRRTAFANDPLNLLAVDGSTNAAKGEGDAATWLPPKASFRCAYVARQVAVKVKYDLWVTSAEREAIVRILETCLTQTLPTATEIPLGGGTVETPARTTTAPAPTAPAPTKTSRSLDPRFDTCKAAKAQGYGPYDRGTDPEYDWYRDADSDGIVCE